MGNIIKKMQYEKKSKHIQNNFTVFWHIKV